MPHTVDDLIRLIGEQVAHLAERDGAMNSVRHSALIRLRDALQSTGFPVDRDRRCELSLIPFMFQEANYDDIDWTDPGAPLGHLTEMFAIDVAVQSGGRQRHELTDGEYNEYVQVGFAAIDYRRRRS